MLQNASDAVLELNNLSKRLDDITNDGYPLPDEVQIEDLQRILSTPSFEVLSQIDYSSKGSALTVDLAQSSAEKLNFASGLHQDSKVSKENNVRNSTNGWINNHSLTEGEQLLDVGSLGQSDGGITEEKDTERDLEGRDMHKRSLAITEPELDDKITGEKVAYMEGILKSYQRTLIERTRFHLGYPYNLDFDYGALAQLQHFSINNLGDPFIESNYGVHSREFEVGVLDWFARLWEIDGSDYWGYITNCGTEGNLHGILVGREVLPDGILYASQDSHYSVFKAARMYRMESVKVATLISGEIDCNDFRIQLEKRKNLPAIINVNIGTTVKGAVDDLDEVIQTLKDVGYSEDRFYIHCDGALFGLMMPFVRKASKVTFKKPIGSVSVSGHKFVGCPMPCGVQITRKSYVAALSRDVEYLASRDATIMGSRNGHAPLFLWYTLNRKGYAGFRRDVKSCLRNAHYLWSRLRDAGIGAMLNRLSSTVVFERPQEEAFVRRWQLACQGKIAHAVVMPSVSVQKLDLFISELIASRAHSSLDGVSVSLDIADEVGPTNCACPLHIAQFTADADHDHTDDSGRGLSAVMDTKGEKFLGRQYQSNGYDSSRSSSTS